MKNKPKRKKPKSIGDKPASKITFREELTAKLFLDVTSRFMTGRFDYETLTAEAHGDTMQHRIVASVDELISEMDKLAESKAIETIAEKIVNSLDSDKDKHKPAKPGLKLAGSETKYICDKVDVIRYKAPADATDDDAGLKFILVHFYLRSGDNRGGVKFKIEDKWPEQITVMASIGAIPVKTMIGEKTAIFTTPSTWKPVKLLSLDDLYVTIHQPLSGSGPDVFTEPSEVVEFDAP